MAISDLLNRRVRAAPDEEEVYSDASGSEAPSEGDVNESGSESGSEGSEGSDDGSTPSSALDPGSEADDSESAEDSEGDEGDDDVKSSLNNISFGALAKAQASFGPGPKNKRRTKESEEQASTASPLDDIRAKIKEAREQKRKASASATASSKDQEKDSSNPNPYRSHKLASRSSKHAPTVQSSKYAVSRKRTIVEPPSVPKTRDPRFDPTIVGSRGGRGSGSAAPSDAYAFLDDYRAAELRSLKEQLSKTKNVKQREALTKEIRSTSDRMRSIENSKREKDIMAEHKKKEKQLIREGKKSTPYFLKKSDVKKQALMQKYEGMKSKDRAKALERRRKKAAAKERKEMPMERRGFEDAPRKRQRVE